LEVDITKKAKNLIRFGLIGLILLAALAGGGIYLYQHYNRNLTVYDAQTACTMVDAKTKAEGKLTELTVADGDHVEAGDVIAHVAPKVTDEQVQQLEQNLALAKQSLEQLQKGGVVSAPSAVTVPVPAAAPRVDSGAQQRAAQALSRMQRMNELFSMGAVSAVKRDEAAAEYASAQAAANSAPAVSSSPSVSSSVPQAATSVPTSPEVIKQAELQVKQAEAALNNAKEDQQATDILAPVAGTVYYTDVAEGDDLKAGQTVVNIGDADNVWLEAKLNPDQAKKVRLGQFASYTIEGHELQGTIQDIQNPADDNADEDDSDGDSGPADSSDSSSSGAKQSTPTDARTTVKLSLPTGLSFNVQPGMKAVVKFAIDR
jgi:membrane fusion protein (multidrug efflux system)